MKSIINKLYAAVISPWDFFLLENGYPFPVEYQTVMH